MFWLEALSFAVVIGLSFWTSGWLKRHPELTLRQMLGRLAGGVLLLAFGAVTLWTLMPGMQGDPDGGFICGSIFLLIGLLRELPVVRVLPVGRRWGLYAVAASWLPVAVTLALGALHPDAPGEVMLDFFLPTALTLLVMLPAFAALAWVWNRFVRGWARRLILPGPDEPPTSRR